MLVLNGLIQFYDPLNMTLIKTITNYHSNYFCMEILQPTGNIVAAYQYLDIYNTTYDLIFSSAYTSPSTINSLRLLPDNLTLVCWLSNGSFLLFNSNTFSFGSLYSVHTSYGVLLLTPDFIYLVSGGRDYKLIFWVWSSMSLTPVKVFSMSAQIISGLFIDASFSGKNFF
jgi:hypothetical protein